MALFARAGWKGLSGPMVAVEWPKIDPASERQFWRLVSGELIDSSIDAPSSPLKAIKPGISEGLLLGGNMTVLSRMIGTPFLPALEGAILFLEDVNEPAYKIDAMLAQLKLSGIWDNLGGLLIGQFTDQDHLNDTPREIEEVFRDYCENVRFPVASGLRYGHIPVKIAMPIGIRVRLSVEKDTATWSMLEPLVARRS